MTTSHLFKFAGGSIQSAWGFNKNIDIWGQKKTIQYAGYQYFAQPLFSGASLLIWFQQECVCIIRSGLCSLADLHRGSCGAFIKLVFSLVGISKSCICSLVFSYSVVSTLGHTKAKKQRLHFVKIVMIQQIILLANLSVVTPWCPFVYVFGNTEGPNICISYRDSPACTHPKKANRV